MDLIWYPLIGGFISDFQQSSRVCPKQRFLPEISTFCHFCTGRTNFSHFQPSARFVQNSVFSPKLARFLIFALGTPLLRVFSKVHEFVQNRSYQPEIRTFCSFLDWEHYFLAIFSKVQEFLQNSAFSPTSAPFVLFALGTLLFSDFQQSGRVCRKQSFEPKISTFCHFCTRCTTF